MRIDTIHAGQSALTRTHADKTSCAGRRGESSVQQVDLLPYIGVGTFLVAALLRPSPRVQPPR
jgi:hypothetical protein